MEAIRYQESDLYSAENFGAIEGYKGVCDTCGAPLEITEKIIVLRLKVTERADYLFPFVNYHCAACGAKIGIIRVWKNMNVTDELQAVKKGASHEGK